MDFSTQCWDCPVPFTEALLVAGTILLALVLGVRLGAAKTLIPRLLGMLVVAIALLGYVLYVTAFLRWGVMGPGRYLQTPVQRPVVIVWLALSAFVTVALELRLRRRAREKAVGGV